MAKKKDHRNSVNILCSIFLLVVIMGLPYYDAKAEKLTVWERQKILMKNINDGQKTKQITVEDAKKFRKKLAEVSRDKTKMKRKNNGTLSASDIIKLEGALNDISLNIKKARLETRLDTLKENKDNASKKSDKSDKKNKPWWKR